MNLFASNTVFMELIVVIMMKMSSDVAGHIEQWLEQ